MKIIVRPNPDALGAEAARLSARYINEAIERQGRARIVLSTGASQFATIEHLTRADIDWSKVEMFHLDEYVGLPETHIASFRKYLKERFVDKTGITSVHFVPNDESQLHQLCDLLETQAPDLGLIGIGQNTHIAFNAPPADFEFEGAYLTVTLDERCKRQQVSEGWFETVDDVPPRAITMSVKQIMRARAIISAVPYPEKAEAVMRTLTESVSNLTPATILKTHPDFTLLADSDSFALTDKTKIIMPEGVNYTLDM